MSDNFQRVAQPETLKNSKLGNKVSFPGNLLTVFLQCQKHSICKYYV